ncbi:hypothetical protein Y032_0001g21 [Ancylostoma ceylanicum]|nr:hypothetical protein Y032_0001g21 [Ancylostoma ceylanicum]
MTMFQDMMREEKKEMMEMFLKHHTRSEPVMGANEMASVPNVMSAMSSRIDKFVFDPNTDMCFTKWFLRYKDVFVEDAKQLTESARGQELEKSDAEDYPVYTSRVNEFCERAKIHDLDCDGTKCLLWIFGLKSQREAEIRQRLIAVLDKEYKVLGA